MSSPEFQAFCVSRRIYSTKFAQMAWDHQQLKIDELKTEAEKLQARISELEEIKK